MDLHSCQRYGEALGRSCRCSRIVPEFGEYRVDGKDTQEDGYCGGNPGGF